MNGLRKFLVLFCCGAVLLGGCARRGEPMAAVTEPSATEAIPVETQPATTVATEPLVTEPEEVQLMEQAPEPAVPLVLEAEATGTRQEVSDAATVDYSHMEDGYVMVRYTAETEQRLKVLVRGPTTTYNYNLPKQEWTVFPLSDGSGAYQVGVYENIVDSKYATVMVAEFEVELTDEFAPFLRPNQYVNYSVSTKAVEKSAELNAGLEEPLEKVDAVYHYVIGTLEYDSEKAATVKSGYLPDLDQVLEAEKGICFDYAALMAAMLRSQGVPCKLVVGYAGEIYHSWISVWTENAGWIDGMIFFDGQVWKRMDPTFAASGELDPEIMDYIENGNYIAKYLY